MQNELLRELEARGFINQSSNLDGLNDALNAGRVTAYWGTDPTGDSLHVGHLASLMLMRWFQKYGHRPIALVGGATGRIGDPSGRDKGRPMLTDAQIEHNCAGLRRSISKFIHFGDGETDAVMVDNNDWMKNYGHMEFLREFGTDFTVPRMLSMESVRRRLENGMTFLEFNYMTFQAVDFLTLYKKYGCTLQFCGADQWGNSIMGVELIRKKLGKEAFVLSTSLITDARGEKIGKSAGNAVWVNEDKTSPYEYYQYFRNTPDDLVEKFLKIFTEIPLDEIARLSKLQGAELNTAKKILAFAATEIAHGRDAAVAAESAADALFAGGANSDNVPSIDLDFSAPMNIVDFLVATKLFPSKSEARRMIEQGGIQIDGNKITDWKCDIAPADEVMVQKGKKTFLRVKRK
ncbi:MAG TPA: tyrosine--tRNA ligase [Candidatus Enterousia intestinigallinarum]|uniref:Tyrosine--tRNA ligase n=1 Tax=Candidatus Enterousia intestinigallinarum TaxID=2840790 RepID=A0A9D1FHE0_9PROT|nr:tyrosine--tRNA ligase [Candidatus Enterousia intestinigallinarum]